MLEFLSKKLMLKWALVLLLITLGLFAPRFAHNRPTSNWLIWFIRRLLPVICYGAAIGVAIS